MNNEFMSVTLLFNLLLCVRVALQDTHAVYSVVWHMTGGINIYSLLVM